MDNGFEKLQEQFDATVEFAALIGEWFQAVAAQVKSEMVGHGWPPEYAERAGYEAALSMIRNVNREERKQ